MYKLTYNHNCRYCTKTFKDINSLLDELYDVFSLKLINEVAQTFEKNNIYRGTYFDVDHYVGYFYKGESYTTLYTLAQKLVKEIDEETKIDWFIQNVGACARKDNGDEIELPWYDMFSDDYDHKAFDGYLADEVDDSVVDEIEKALEKLIPKSGSFVFSFFGSDFNIEVEEDDRLDITDDEEYEEEEED